MSIKIEFNEYWTCKKIINDENETFVLIDLIEIWKCSSHQTIINSLVLTWLDLKIRWKSNNCLAIKQGEKQDKSREIIM